MKLYINGQEVRGHTRDIAEVLATFSEYKLEDNIIAQDNTLTTEAYPEPLAYDDPYPYEAVVKESVDVRAELDRNPLYNPFGGVVTPVGGEATVDVPTAGTTNMAEVDTGVQR